jgi:ubiquinone/menaquinone biosynthesis C-methylase UbiE
MDFQELFKLGMARDVPQLVTVEGRALNIGAGNKQIAGAEPLDWPEWDADKEIIPFPDGTFATIYAFHFLEHVQSPVSLLLEMQRVLIAGGVINICVPYYNSQLMAQDLDHKHSRFCEQTWKLLFRNQYYNKNRIEWRLEERFNLICGIVERNMCLLTQLVKKE